MMGGFGRTPTTSNSSDLRKFKSQLRGGGSEDATKGEEVTSPPSEPSASSHAIVAPTSVQPPPLPSLPVASTPVHPKPKPFVNVQVYKVLPPDDLADMPPTDNAVAPSTLQLSQNTMTIVI